MRPHAAAPSLLTLHLLWMAALLTAMVTLTGCGAGRILPPSDQSGVPLHGNVHGGQQPVVAARVYLLAANTTGYAGNGIAPTSLNASVSLLNAADTGYVSDIGAYVLTDDSGSFSISGDYTCTANSQVYLYVQGGNPGGGTNSALGLMAALGNCPGTGTFAAATPYIEINELSTVAAAYAFAGFATDSIHVSSNGSPLALTGIANAFANAANLVDLGSGTALSTTPVGNGTVPTATINTLGNILASCVNTENQNMEVVSGSPHPLSARPLSFPYSSACHVLGEAVTGNNLSNLENDQYDTATAAIFIAQNPGANVSSLYTLPTPDAPFSPALTSQPNDFSLSIPFTLGSMNYTQQLAVDASGNIWLADGNNSLDELSPLGTLLSGNGFTDASLQQPQGLAIDSIGNIWVANTSSNSAPLSEFDNTGTFLRTAPAPVTASQIAIDPNGDLWVPYNNGGGAGGVAELSSSGGLLGSFTSTGLDQPSALAIDPSGNVWLSSSGSQRGLVEFNNAGTPNPSNPFTAGGILASPSIALDSANDVWTLNGDGSLSAITSNGTPFTGSPFNTGTGANPTALAIDGQNHVFALTETFDDDDCASTHNLLAFDNAGNSLTPSGITAPTSANDLALDGAGNLWISNGSTVVEYIGIAAPVVTPLSAAVRTNCIGQMPCNVIPPAPPPP